MSDVNMTVVPLPMMGATCQIEMLLAPDVKDSSSNLNNRQRLQMCKALSQRICFRWSLGTYYVGSRPCHAIVLRPSNAKHAGTRSFSFRGIGVIWHGLETRG